LPVSRDLANSVAKMRLVQLSFGFAIQLELSKISRKNAIQQNSNIKKWAFPNRYKWIFVVVGNVFVYGLLRVLGT